VCLAERDSACRSEPVRVRVQDSGGVLRKNERRSKEGVTQAVKQEPKRCVVECVDV